MTSLGSLADPLLHNDPCHIEGISKDEALLILERMILIRLAEECIGNYVEDGTIACPCHLGIGQEAAAVGTCIHLGPQDRCFGAHRSHSHYLALGAPVEGLMSEVLGKDSGCSRGMGGSMHIVSKEHGLYGTVPIVGATIPIAAGAGLALKNGKTDGIAVCFFGDGACEEGVFHETLNLASVYELPVLFVVENNLFSSHLHISLRQPSDSIARFAKAHHIEHSVIDGNDVAEVSRVAKEAISRARTKRQPFLLEAVTYRWRGHVGHREDVDVGVKRSEDLDLWKKRDPISRLIQAVLTENLVSESELEDIRNKVQELVSSSWKLAEQSAYPDKEALLDRVWCNGEAK